MGWNCSGVIPKCTILRITRTAIPAYRIVPTDQAITVSAPSRCAASPSGGRTPERPTASDWEATDHTNQLPSVRSRIRPPSRVISTCQGST